MEKWDIFVSILYADTARPQRSTNNMSWVVYGKIKVVVYILIKLKLQFMYNYYYYYYD
jgi:hypothetical protein